MVVSPVALDEKFTSGPRNCTSSCSGEAFPKRQVLVQLSSSLTRMPLEVGACNNTTFICAKLLCAPVMKLIIVAKTTAADATELTAHKYRIG